MYNGKIFTYKSLIICFTIAIFLCSAAMLGVFTVKSIVSAQEKSDVTLTLDGVFEDELAPRIYGNSYEPITATAVETGSGNVISGYGYVIQYNDDAMSGAWTTTVPKNAGRYPVRAYGAATATYTEALSDVAYLTITPRILEVNFIDEYKISNTEGGTRQYNGQPYRIRAEFTNVVPGDNLVPITGGGNAINASDTPYKFNVYGFSAPNSTIKANYDMKNTPYPYLITRVPMTVVWSDLTQTYDGTQKDPSVTWESAPLMPVGDPEVVAAERINAGSYTVTAEYNGEDSENFEIVNPTETFVVERLKIGISLSARASYGNEAILKALINPALSDPIPAGDTEYVQAQISSAPLETNWTPTSNMNQAYYAYLAGHNESRYLDYDLMPNYVVEWRRAIYYPSKANVVSIEWSENDYTYTAAEQTITAEGLTDFGGTITLEITINKEFKNAANDYVATATISASDAENIQFGYGVATTKDYEIKKATATIVWSVLAHAYDGAQKNPSATWESAAVTPEGDPEVVAAERINAGSYMVTAEYNGTDKDNFYIVNASDVLIIDRTDLTVTITLVESSVIFGDDFEADISATWYLTSEQSNNVLLLSLIAGYSAGDNAGVYTITLDFDKAEDENRRSPETFIDNYRITDINDAVLTVNKKVITSSELEEWVNSGDIIFNGETVVYDGNKHMIYAEINGSACGVITVSEYLVDGNPFDGASAVADYNITALIVPVNDNYTAEGLTVSAILCIYENEGTGNNSAGGTTSSGGGNSGGGLPSSVWSGFTPDTIITVCLIIIIIATIFGFIAILVIVKKFREELAE